MKKRYSSLYRKAKNGRRLSNFFYRFGKSILIVIASIGVVAVFVNHSTTFSSYEVYRNNFALIFNVSYQYIKTETIPAILSLKTYAYAYYVYNDEMDEDAKMLANYYHVDDIFQEHSPTVSGVVVLIRKDKKYCISQGLGKTAILRAALYLGLLK